MNAALLAELEIEKSKRDRAKAAVTAREVKAGRQEPILGIASIPKISEQKPCAIRVSEKAAASANVSERKVKQALAVHRADPQLAEVDGKG